LSPSCPDPLPQLRDFGVLAPLTGVLLAG